MLSRRAFLRTIGVGAAAAGLGPFALGAGGRKRPNVILILTDDQGYGDMSCHGNPILKTPEMDRLHAESVRFTNFHVSAFCSPSRAAIMTGQYPGRTGAFRTSSGRTFVDKGAEMMGDVFQRNGYETAMFGKWHLGDNYPYRPQDRGFGHVLWHKCGGVGQISDYWGNDYFDDHYEEDGVIKPFKGYCTDVWFDGALGFIRKQRDRGRPFFVYLATNAPHGPYLVDRKYRDPYREMVTWSQGANFYGMIANIDENLGRLRRKLRQWGIEDDTILVFMTDNGTSKGGEFKGLTGEPTVGYNAGMRGHKSSHVEGGHRVPFFIRWPNGGISGGRDVDLLAGHIDILPSFVELCGLDPGRDDRIDGESLAGVLRGEETDLNNRIMFAQYHGGPYYRYQPQLWSDSCVMKEHWRLIDGKELYNTASDPAQRYDVSDEHPELVRQLRRAQEQWFRDIEGGMKSPHRIHLGSAKENPAMLTSHDWYLPVGNPPWSQGHVRGASYANGPWKVHVERDGRYRISLMRWPEELNKPIREPMRGKGIEAVRARLKIGGFDGTIAIGENDVAAGFTVDLRKGDTDLQSWLIDPDGKSRGAYYAKVQMLR